MIIAVVLLAVATCIHHTVGQTVTDAAFNETVTTAPAAEAVEALLPESVESNGTLFVIPNSGDDLYGATVKLRQSKAVTGDAYTIMIDSEHALPAGALQYFYVFIEQKVPSPSNLRLQIWRQNDDYGNDRYQLVWQRLAYLNDSSPQALYTFNVSDDEFQVTEGDFIGWTGEDNYRIVSRDAALPTCLDCSRTRYIPGDTMDFWLPKVRVEPYSDITPTARQFTFSAAVKIKRPATVPVLLPTTRPGPLSSTLRVSISPTPSTSIVSWSTTTTKVRVYASADHITAVTIGVVFGIFGAVIVAITAIVIWKRRADCTPAVIWSVLKKDSTVPDSRTELLESGSSTTGSTERGDDVDSASVTTSSSSEVTAAAGVVARDRDRGVGARPKCPAAGPRAAAVSRTHDPLSGVAASSRRPIFAKYDREARDNDGFVDDELTVTSGQDKQQQQQQQGAASRVADTRTHCVSVDLHSPPRALPGLETGNESMV